MKQVLAISVGHVISGFDFQNWISY